MCSSTNDPGRPRATERLHRRHALSSGRPAGRVLRQHMPRGRHRRRVLSAEAREVYEEGLRDPDHEAPPAPASRTTTSLRSSGERARARETIGDLYAQIVLATTSEADRLVAAHGRVRSRCRSTIADEIIFRGPSARCAPASLRCPDGTYRTRPGATASTSRSALALRCHGRGRRPRDRLAGQLAAEPARDQSRAQLHARIRFVRGQSGARPGGAAQRRLVQARSRDGTAGFVLNCVHPHPWEAAT